MPGDDPMIQIGQIRVPNAARPFPDPPPAPCPECARLRERVAELEAGVSSVPCCKCRGPVREFVVPNGIWNAIVRRGGPETDQEYLCDGCYRDICHARIQELLVSIVEGVGWYVREGDMAGWWDTGANSTVRDAGDELVAMGLWERHPDGVGRRWFYRPKQTAPPTGG